MNDERTDALCDRAFGLGMRLALQFAETDEGKDQARKIADRLTADALPVILATRNQQSSP
jgi:hypothetical protein